MKIKVNDIIFDRNEVEFGAHCPWTLLRLDILTNQSGNDKPSLGQNKLEANSNGIEYITYQNKEHRLSGKMSVKIEIKCNNLTKIIPTLAMVVDTLQVPIVIGSKAIKEIFMTKPTFEDMEKQFTSLKLLKQPIHGPLV